MAKDLARALGRGALALLVPASLAACGGGQRAPVAEGTSPHELCEAATGFKPASFYCVGERSSTEVGTLGPRGRPLADTLVSRCWGGKPPTALRVEAQELDPAKLSFGFDLMADGRGRIPAAQVFPWAGPDAFLHADAGAVVHVRYAFEKARRERLVGVREALRDVSDRDCLEALCYQGFDVSLDRYVASPRLTLEADTGKVEGLGGERGPGSTYTIDPHEQIVVATRAVPGPAVAGELCRRSAAEKMWRSAEMLVEALLRSSPCLLLPAVAEILNTSCHGRACDPTSAATIPSRRLGSLPGFAGIVCRTVEREISRLPSHGPSPIRCEPDFGAFVASHRDAPLEEVFSGGTSTFGLLQALLAGGKDAALSAALDWLSLRPGTWLDAQQSWEAGRQYDGELPGVPAATWHELRVGVYRKTLANVASGSQERLGVVCEDAAVVWNTEEWAVVHAPAGHLLHAPLLRTVRGWPRRTAARLADALSAP